MHLPDKEIELKTEVNLAPGIAALVLGLGMVVLGFMAGVKLMPFGVAPIVAWIFCAMRLIREKKVSYGYTSVFVCMMLMAVPLVLQDSGLVPGL